MSTSPEGYLLRPYTPNDRKPLMDFFMNLQRGNRRLSEDLMLCVLSRNVTVLVAEFEQHIVGYGEFHKRGFRSIYFHHAAVLKPNRRMGIFTHILDEVVNRAGKSEITAEVTQDAKHLDLMKRVGFVITEELSRQRYAIKRPRLPLFR